MSNDMRLPLVDVDRRDGVSAGIFEQIRSARSEVSNLFRVVANEPTLLPAFFGLSKRVRDESMLPPRLAQLAILATAFAIGSSYEIAHHVIEAERAGITPDEIAHLSEHALREFAPTEQAVISYAWQVTSARTVDDATFNHVLAALGPSGTIELAVLVGWYHLVAAVVEPIRVTLEADKRREGTPGNAQTRDSLSASDP